MEKGSLRRSRTGDRPARPDLGVQVRVVEVEVRIAEAEGLIEEASSRRAVLGITIVGN